MDKQYKSYQKGKNNLRAKKCICIVFIIFCKSFSSYGQQVHYKYLAGVWDGANTNNDKLSVQFIDPSFVVTIREKNQKNILGWIRHLIWDINSIC
jgi:hypothetical protein